MSDITLYDLFGHQKGYGSYLRGEFADARLSSAQFLARIVGAEMRKREPRAGEAVIKLIAFAMPQEPRGLFLADVGNVFGGTDVYKIVQKEMTLPAVFGGIEVKYKAAEQTGSGDLMGTQWSNSPCRAPG